MVVMVSLKTVSDAHQAQGMSQLGRRQRALRHALRDVVASQRTVGTDAVALVLAHGLEDGLADLLPPAVAGSGNSSVHDRIAETIGMPASWPWVSVDARSFSPAPTSPFLNLIALARSMVSSWRDGFRQRTRGTKPPVH